jgi:hypothetical protein
MATLLLSVMGAFAEFEHALILKRQRLVAVFMLLRLAIQSSRRLATGAGPGTGAGPARLHRVPTWP